MIEYNTTKRDIFFKVKEEVKKKYDISEEEFDNTNLSDIFSQVFDELIDEMNNEFVKYAIKNISVYRIFNE